MPDRGDRLESLGLVLVAALVPLVLLTPSYVVGVRAKSVVFLGLTLALAATAVAAAWRRGRLEVSVSAGSLGLLLLGLAATAATPAARFGDVAREALPYAWALFVVHASVVSLLRARVERGAHVAVLLRNGLAGGLAAVVLVSFAGLLGFLHFRTDLATGSATEMARSQYLATPFFQHSYLAVQATLLFVPVAVAFVLVGKNLLVRLLCVGALLPLVAFIAATLSRSAWLAVAAGTAFVLLGVLRAVRAGRPWLLPSHPASAAVAVGSLALVALAFAWLGTQVGALHDVWIRFTSLLDPELTQQNFSRLEVWKDTARLVRDHLLQGVGPGAYGFEIGRYHQGARFPSHAHNQALQTLAEIGPLGLVGVVVALLHPIALCWRSLRSPERPAVFARLGVGGGLTALVVCGVFESPLQFPVPGLFLALGAAVVVGLDPRAGRVLVVEGRRLNLALVVVGMGLAALVGVGAGPIARTCWSGHLGHRAERALAAGDAAGAARWAEQAARASPHYPALTLIEAQMLLAHGDAAGAIDAYGRHSSVQPGMGPVLMRRAALLLTEERYPEAAEVLEQAVERVPPEAEPDATLKLAFALTRAQRHAEARPLLLDLMERLHHLERPEVLLRLAEVELHLGQDRRRAVELLERYRDEASEAEAEYAATLLEQLDTFFPGWPRLELLDDELREPELARHAITRALGLRPGETVAYVRAGPAPFLELLCDGVGRDGHVIVTDTDEDAIRHLAERIRVAGLSQARTQLGDPKSPGLPPGSVDVAFCCSSYHHFEFPADVLANLHAALRTEGRLVVVDLHRKPGVSPDWVLEHVRGGKQAFLEEIEEAGFHLANEVFLPELRLGYMLVFDRVRSSREGPAPGRR